MVVNSVVGDDGLDDAIWRALQEIIVASWHGDREDFVASAFRLDDALARNHDGRSAVYMYYLLGSRIYDDFHRVPTEQELNELADRVLPELWRVADFRGEDLLDLFAYLFLGKSETVLSGAAFVLITCGVLGILLDDPVAELAPMRPKLADWYRENVK